MNTETYPHPPKEIRLTIPVSVDVHEAFTRISKAGRVPVGRAMGEWLADTLEAAQFMADKMEQARTAPKLVARELHSYALGLTDMTQDLLETVRKRPASAGERATQEPSQAAPGASSGPLTPPSSNTGGKVPVKGKKKAGD